MQKMARFYAQKKGTSRRFCFWTEMTFFSKSTYDFVTFANNEAQILAFGITITIILRLIFIAVPQSSIEKAEKLWQ